MLLPAERRVLFVDGDGKLLRELEPALRSAPGEWAVSCTTSAAEALELLSRAPFDAVVAGADLPGADGRSFLDEVARRQPGAARFQLAQKAGRDVLLQADSAAHQHLARPLRTEELFSRLAQTLLLDRLLTDGQLKALVSRLKSIPSPTPIYLALMGELRQENASAQRAGELVARDGGMSAKILQLVNSPFFGLRMPVVDAAHAVRLLGLNTLRALVLSLHVFEQVNPRTVQRFGLGRIWRHATAAGGLARLIASLQNASPEAASEAFSAAMVHDVGKLVLAGSLPDDYAFVVQQAEAERVPTWQVEAEWLGATHAEVGAYLLGLWGVPASIVEAVAHHHRPSRAATAGYFPLGAVHVANAVEHQLHPADVVGAASALDEDYLAQYDLADRVPIWTAACVALAEEAAGPASRAGGGH